MSGQTMIRNYGLFWKSEDVFWGKPKHAGALFGVLADKKKDERVDFRDQRGIYALYAEYHLVYVGQNLNQELLKRLKQHREDDLANRWNRFSWYGIRTVNNTGTLSKLVKAAHVDVGDALNHIEAILIHTSEPALNRQGGKFGPKVERYLQARDQRLGPSGPILLEQLHRRLITDAK